MDNSRGFGLLSTLIAAVAVFVAAVVLLLVFDPRVTGADAVRTGGLAAGAIIALYALWLNDRRRRVEEARHELERAGNEQDRERVADERFARAVELLGHETDQVRVGALHSLAGLARSRPGYAQTVLDVLCSYLRRPFDHPGFGQDDESTGELDAAREWQVRLTAQRLITELLPDSEHADGPDLDLTGAMLHYVDFADRRIGNLTLRGTRLYGTFSLAGATVGGDVYFTRAEVYGYLNATGARFLGRSRFHYLAAHDSVTFENVYFGHSVVLQHGRFDKDVSLLGAELRGSIDLRNASFHDRLDLRCMRLTEIVRGAALWLADVAKLSVPQGWTVLPERDGQVKIVPDAAEE